MATLLLYKLPFGQWMVKTDTPSIVRLVLHVGPAGVHERMKPEDARQYVASFNPGHQVVLEGRRR